MEDATKYGNIQTVLQRICLIRKEIREGKLIGKDAENKHKNYKYYSPDTVLNVVNPLLEKYELVVFFNMPYNATKGCYEALTEIFDANEGFKTKSVPFQFDIFKGAVAGANESQNSGSTLTYAKRYSYMNIFDLVDAKDDFDHDSKQPIIPEEKEGTGTFDQAKLDKCTSKAEARAYYNTLTKDEQDKNLSKFSEKKYE